MGAPTSRKIIHRLATSALRASGAKNTVRVSAVGNAQEFKIMAPVKYISCVSSDNRGHLTIRQRVLKHEQTAPSPVGVCRIDWGDSRERPALVRDGIA